MLIKIDIVNANFYQSDKTFNGNNQFRFSAHSKMYSDKMSYNVITNW